MIDRLKKGPIDGVWFDGPIKLWTTTYCAKQFGFTTRYGKATADKKLRRARLRPYARLPGRGGESLWQESEVSKLI